MTLNPDNLRFILGLKLRRLRQERGASLTEISEKAGLSVSYLSEIEKGKKYPKPAKLLDLAEALEVPFDELVSMRVGHELNPLKDLFSSPFIQEFPFELFGLETQDLFGLITDAPGKAGALIRTFLEVGRMYDVQVEHFLFAALRSYQQMNENYFEELEQAAAAFREAEGWNTEGPIPEEALRSVLEHRYHYHINETALPGNEHLCDLRSVFAEGPPRRLYVNGKLTLPQKAFIYGRELGFRLLDLADRPRTSSWIKAESFDEVLNNFKASYFSGALLIDRDRLRDDLAAFFDHSTWDESAFLALLGRYQATPEMFYYRLTELVPRLFDLHAIYFLRFHNDASTDRFRLTKMFNLSPVPVPHGLGLKEHYCRRWPAMKLLHDLAARQQRGANDAPLVLAQRSRFVNADVEYFVVSMARPLSLSESTNSSVSIGFLMDDAFKQTVRLWDDPAIPRVDVNLTCERCPLTPAECQDRVAPPTLYAAQEALRQKEAALTDLLAQNEAAAAQES